MGLFVSPNCKLLYSKNWSRVWQILILEEGEGLVCVKLSLTYNILWGLKLRGREGLLRWQVDLLARPVWPKREHNSTKEGSPLMWSLPALLLLLVAQFLAMILEFQVLHFHESESSHVYYYSSGFFDDYCGGESTKYCHKKIIIVTTFLVSENDELKSAQWKVQMSHGLCMCAYMDRTESELPRGSINSVWYHTSRSWTFSMTMMKLWNKVQINQ